MAAPQPEKIDSKFRFVLLCAQRAERLMQGARAKPGVDEKKPTQAAMREIDDGLLEWGYGPPPAEEVEEPEPEA